MSAKQERDNEEQRGDFQYFGRALLFPGIAEVRGAGEHAAANRLKKVGGVWTVNLWIFALSVSLLTFYTFNIVIYQFYLADNFQRQIEDEFRQPDS